MVNENMLTKNDAHINQEPLLNNLSLSGVLKKVFVIPNPLLQKNSKCFLYVLALVHHTC